MTERLDDLIARLEAAEGPDVELDRSIVLALKPGAIVGEYVYGDGYYTCFHAEPVVKNRAELPAFTASIDAAVGLTEKTGGDVLSTISDAMEDMRVYGWSRGDEAGCLARYIVLATLRALRAQQGES